MRRSQAFQNASKTYLFVPIIVWFAFTFSIVIYAIAAFIITANPPKEPIALADVIVYAALAFAVLLTIAGYVAYSYLFSDSRLSAFLEREPSTHNEELDPFEQRLMGLYTRAFTPLLLRWALNEAAAIVGLVLAIVSCEPTIIIPFAVVAVVANVLAFPSFGRLFERAERLYRS